MGRRDRKKERKAIVHLVTLGISRDGRQLLATQVSPLLCLLCAHLREKKEQESRRRRKEEGGSAEGEDLGKKCVSATRRWAVLQWNGWSQRTKS